VLSENDFDELHHVVAHTSLNQVEKGATGVLFQGVALDAPLSVMARQELMMVKFFLKVSEVAEVASVCANETLMERSRRSANQRFWPSATANDATLLFEPGPNQVTHD